MQPQNEPLHSSEKQQVCISMDETENNVQYKKRVTEEHVQWNSTYIN